MKRHLVFFLIALTILGLTAKAYCYPAEVIDISAKKYSPAVQEALSKAQKSIYLVMYFVNFDPQVKESPVNELIEEMVSVHQRGVKVKVILDQNVNWENKSGKRDCWEMPFSVIFFVTVQLLEDSAIRLCHNYEKCQFCHSEGAKRLKNLDDK